MVAQVVFITGCSKGGIGYSLVEAFASRGATVYATARNLASLSDLPASVNLIALDVNDAASCEKVIAQVLAKEGRIDILINNAGQGGAGPSCEFPIEDAQSCFNTNVFAPMRLTQLVVPSMAARKSGLIIFIGSVVGLIPTPWAGIYAASKAAIHSYSETLRSEVKGLGLQVLLVAPGAITSGFGKKQEDSFTLRADSLFASVAGRIQERAQMSQKPGSTMPSAILAAGIADRALSKNPPTFYTAGGKAWLFTILTWLPKSVVWYLLEKSTGCGEVGK